MDEVTQAAPEALPAAPEVPVTDSTPTAEPAEAGSFESEMSQTFDKAQARAPNGQFARTRDMQIPAEESFQLARPFEAEAVEGEQPALTDAEGETQAGLEPVRSLPSKLKELWSSISPELQEWITGREQEAHAKISELGMKAAEAAKLDAAAPLNEVAQRWAHVMPKGADGNTIAPHAAFEHLLAAEHVLRENPVAGLQWLANSYGVDLSQIGHNPEAEARNRENVIRETIREVSRHYEQQIFEQQTAVAMQALDNFARDKADHLNEITPALLDHLNAVRMRDPTIPHHQALELAYKRALAESEPVAQRINLSKTQEQARKDAAERTRKANEAKRLQSINVGSSRSGIPSRVRSDLSKPGAIEESMAEVYEKVRARG